MTTQANQILRKLTIATAIGGKGQVLDIAKSGLKNKGDKEGPFVDMLTVIGRVTKIKPGQTSQMQPNGETVTSEYVKLLGDFSATNLDTGEVIPNISTCILPNFVADSIAAAVMAGAENVDFAVVLTVKYKEAAATMYEFGCRSLIPIAKASSVTDIEAKLALLGIEAPKPRALLAAPNAKADETKPAAKPAKV